MYKTHTLNDYVCHCCFYPLEECTCEFDPRQLIQIDQNVQYAVRVLNQKGYTTECCCEGHFTEKFKGGDMYISFALQCAPKSCPEGWKLSYLKDKHHPVVLINRQIKNNNKDIQKQKKYFETKKKEAIEQLNIWVDNLDINK